MIATRPRRSASGLIVWKFKRIIFSYFRCQGAWSSTEIKHAHTISSCDKDFESWVEQQQKHSSNADVTNSPICCIHIRTKVFSNGHQYQCSGGIVLTSEGMGVGVDFSDFQAVTPICQDEQASLLLLWPDITNNHWAVKFADPQVRITHFSLRLIFRPNNKRITIFQETVRLPFSSFILCSLLQRTSWFLATNYFVCVALSVRIFIYKLARLSTLHHHLKRFFLCIRLFWWSNCLQSSLLYSKHFSEFGENWYHSKLI